MSASENVNSFRDVLVRIGEAYNNAPEGRKMQKAYEEGRKFLLFFGEDGKAVERTLYFLSLLESDSYEKALELWDKERDKIKRGFEFLPIPYEKVLELESWANEALILMEVGRKNYKKALDLIMQCKNCPLETTDKVVAYITSLALNEDENALAVLEKMYPAHAKLVKAWRNNRYQEAYEIAKSLKDKLVLLSRDGPLSGFDLAERLKDAAALEIISKASDEEVVSVASRVVKEFYRGETPRWLSWIFLYGAAGKFLLYLPPLPEEKKKMSDEEYLRELVQRLKTYLPEAQKGDKKAQRKVLETLDIIKKEFPDVSIDLGGTLVDINNFMRDIEVASESVKSLGAALEKLVALDPVTRALSLAKAAGHDVKGGVDLKVSIPKEKLQRILPAVIAEALEHAKEEERETLLKVLSTYPSEVRDEVMKIGSALELLRSANGDLNSALKLSNKLPEHLPTIVDHLKNVNEKVTNATNLLKEVKNPVLSIRVRVLEDLAFATQAYAKLMQNLIDIVNYVKKEDRESLLKAAEKAEESAKLLEDLGEKLSAESLKEWADKIKQGIAVSKKVEWLASEYAKVQEKFTSAVESLKEGLRTFGMTANPSVLSSSLTKILACHTTLKRLADEGKDVKMLVGGEEKDFGVIAEEAANRVLEFYKNLKKNVLESDPRPTVEDVFLKAEREHKVDVPVQLSTRALEWRRELERRLADIMPVAQAKPDMPPTEILSIVREKIGGLEKKETARQGGGDVVKTAEDLERLKEVKTAEGLEKLMSSNFDLALKAARLMVESGFLHEVKKWFDRNRVRIAAHYGVFNPDRFTFEVFLNRYLGTSEKKVNYGPVPVQPRGGERTDGGSERTVLGGSHSRDYIKIV